MSLYRTFSGFELSWHIAEMLVEGTWLHSPPQFLQLWQSARGWPTTAVYLHTLRTNHGHTPIRNAVYHWASNDYLHVASGRWYPPSLSIGACVCMTWHLCRVKTTNSLWFLWCIIIYYVHVLLLNIHVILCMFIILHVSIHLSNV